MGVGAPSSGKSWIRHCIVLWSPESATGNTPIFNAFISGQKIFKKFTQFLGACSFLLFFRISNWRLKITKKNYSHWRNGGGGGGAMRWLPSRSDFFHFHAVFGKTLAKQECIPVACVPPACCLYLPACALLGLGGGGCTWSWWVYLVPGGASGPWGVHLVLAGTWSWGCGVPGYGGTWSQGRLPDSGGMYLVPGGVLDPGGVPAQVLPPPMNGITDRQV